MGLLERMATDNTKTRYENILKLFEMMESDGGLDVDALSGAKTIAKNNGKVMRALYELRRFGLVYPEPKPASKRGVWRLTKLAQESYLPYIRKRLREMDLPPPPEER